MAKPKFTIPNGGMGTKNLRPFYIILVPVIIVFVVINSGYLQRWVPCVTIENETYTTVQYNYYYFSVYNDFLSENEANLDEIGFDTNTSAKNQAYNDSMSYFDYFCELAQERMSKVAYYNDLAEEASYTFSEEELSAVDERMAQIEEERAINSLSLSNYLTAYYGVGMSESVYRSMLEKETKANAYAAYLKQNYEPSAKAVSDWIANHKEVSNYYSANLKMIELIATTDRYTGETEQAQLDSLTKKVHALKLRYVENPENFEELCEQFCENNELKESRGILTGVTKDQLTEQISEWVFDSKRKSNDENTFVDEENGKAYLIIYESQGESAATMEAKNALADEQMESDFEKVSKEYEPKAHGLGMQLIGR